MSCSLLSASLWEWKDLRGWVWISKPVQIPRGPTSSHQQTLWLQHTWKSLATEKASSKQGLFSRYRIYSHWSVTNEDGYRCFVKRGWKIVQLHSFIYFIYVRTWNKVCQFIVGSWYLQLYHSQNGLILACFVIFKHGMMFLSSTVFLYVFRWLREWLGPPAGANIPLRC